MRRSAHYGKRMRQPGRPLEMYATHYVRQTKKDVGNAEESVSG